MKNDMKPERDAVLLLERLLVLGAQLDDPRHVGFVEGREDRGGLLDLDQALGDPLAEPAHALAGFSRAVWPARHGAAGAAAPARLGWAGAAAGVAGGLRRAIEVGQDVPLGDAAAGPGGGDPGDVDAFLGDQPADGRRERSTAAPSAAAGAAGAGGRGAAARGLLRRRGRGPRAAAALQPAAAAIPPGRSCRRSRRWPPSRLPRRRSSGRPSSGAGTTLLALSVSSSNSGSPAWTDAAVGLEPARQDPLGDRLAHAGHCDRNGGHGQLTPGRAVAAACCRIDVAETR